MWIRSLISSKISFPSLTMQALFNQKARRKPFARAKQSKKEMCILPRETCISEKRMYTSEAHQRPQLHWGLNLFGFFLHLVLRRWGVSGGKAHFRRGLERVLSTDGSLSPCKVLELCWEDSALCNCLVSPCP